MTESSVVRAKAKALVFNMMERLGPNGEYWLKGSLWSTLRARPSGEPVKCCVIGAAILCMNDMGLDGKMRSDVASTLWEKVVNPVIEEGGFSNIGAWNDHTDRKFEDVKLLLDYAYDQL